MATPPREIEMLVAMLARLPGLGPRSARRVVLHLLRRREGTMLPLSEALRRVAETTCECTICGNIAAGPICDICADPRRGGAGICVVETLSDLWAIERAGAFGGRYHVLGGTLSALDGIDPESLRIPDLVARVARERTPEVILALNATLDGQTTAHVIAEALAPTGSIVSRLARGVPVGGELEYLDEGTIGAALKARARL
jgi:recombination protein RecR